MATQAKGLTPALAALISGTVPLLAGGANPQDSTDVVVGHQPNQIRWTGPSVKAAAQRTAEKSVDHIIDPVHNRAHTPATPAMGGDCTKNAGAALGLSSEDPIVINDVAFRRATAHA